MPSLLKPGVVLTLYAPPGHLQAFGQQLAAQHGWMPHPQAADVWQAADEALFMLPITLPASDDVAALQFHHNAAPDNAGDGWPAARARLAALLPAATLAAVQPVGWTLTYLAESSAELPQRPAALDSALPLHAAEDDVAHAVRSADISDAAGQLVGRLWLTHAPVGGHSAPPAIVYAAVARAGQEAALNAELFGRVSAYQMPDAVAHKAYAWMRHYHSDPTQAGTEATLKQLETETTELLDHLDDQRATEQELAQLARRYDGVVGLVPKLERTRYNLVKQRVNFDQWTADLPAAAIWAFHRSHIEMAITELDLLLARARATLDAAGTTVNLVQARQAQMRQAGDRWRDGVLAVIGAVLALAEFFDRTAAATVLACFDQSVVACLAADSTIGDHYTVSALIVVQFLFFLAVGLAIFALLRRRAAR